MQALMGSQIKIRESSDIIGLQICGCVKNIYAIIVLKNLIMCIDIMRKKNYII